MTMPKWLGQLLCKMGLHSLEVREFQDEFTGYHLVDNVWCPRCCGSWQATVWQAKDYADGWIDFKNKRLAFEYQKETGALVRSIQYWPCPIEQYLRGKDASTIE